MGDNNDEDQSLKNLFIRAEKLNKEADAAVDTLSTSFKEIIATAIATYEECRKLADQLALFSPNETVDDIASGDLQYLLINYRLGDLLLRDFSSNRASQLERARHAYEAYLSLQSSYSLLTDRDTKLYASYNDSPQTFSTISTNSMEARRAAKIMNFQYEKELKRKLEALAQDPAYYESKDEDAVRELHLANLALCTHHTFQALEGINRELEVLKLAPPPSAPDDNKTGRENSTFGTFGGDLRDDRGQRGLQQDPSQRNNEYSERLDRPLADLLASGTGGPLLSSKGKPLRPFTLLDARQREQAGVFRPGHSLPTMTIEEYLAEEKRRGGIIEGTGEENMPAEGYDKQGRDEDNYDRNEAEVMKAREWDEYVEANPKGSGNTLNRG
jgi:immunoglobulin-binding protein 1